MGDSPVRTARRSDVSVISAGTDGATHDHPRQQVFAIEQGLSLIGGILAITAAYLAYECKGLLTGESASRAVVSEIERIIAEESDIYRLNELLIMHF